MAKLSPQEHSSGESTSANDNPPRSAAADESEKKQQFLAYNHYAPGVKDGGAAASAEVHSGGPAQSSVPVTSSAIDMQNGTVMGGNQRLNQDEMLRLKQELVAANSRIALQEQELAQSRVIKHTFDQAMGPPSEVDFGGREITEQTISNLQNTFNAATRPYSQRQDAWVNQDDAHSDISDALSAGGYNRARGTWNNSSQPPIKPNGYGNADNTAALAMNNAISEPNRDWGTRPATEGFNNQGGFAPGGPRMMPGPNSPPPYALDNRFPVDNVGSLHQHQPPNNRSMPQVNRAGSCFPPQNSPWGTFPPLAPGGGNPRIPNQPQLAQYQQAGMVPGQGQYQPRPIGTPLSPTAAEFTSFNSGGGSWASSVSVIVVLR